MSLYSKKPRFKFGNFATDDFYLYSAEKHDWRSLGTGRGMDRIRCKRPPARGRGRAGHFYERCSTRSGSFSGDTHEQFRSQRRVLSVPPGSGRGRTDRHGSGQADRSRRYSMSAVSRPRPMVLSRVPGGSISDPLNLQAIGRGEELPDPPALPEPDPKRFDKPVNNLIPTNRLDPLGLTQREDDQTPLCLPYHPSKRKRVRAKKKDPAVVAVGDIPASQSNSSTADSNAAPPHATATSTSSLPDTADGAANLDHQSVPIQSNSNVPSISEAAEKSKPVPDTVELQLKASSSGDTVMEEVSRETEPILTDAVKVERSLTGVVALDMEPSTSHSVSDSCASYRSDAAKPGTSGAAKPYTSCGPQSKTSTSSDGQGVCDMEMSVEVREKMFEKSSKKQKVSGRATCPSPPPIPSGNKRTSNQKHPVAAVNRRGQNEPYAGFTTRSVYERFIKEEQQRNRMYPIMQSPIGEADRQEVPRDRKSLMKALRIEPYGAEERERVIKEQEKKERDFKRLWRYPNLKSPAEEEQSSKARQSSINALQIDTNLSATVSSDMARGRPVLRGMPSRAVDSIVSPVLRPDPSQARKRRRTVSECSKEASVGAAKALHFRRSSSPEVSMTGTPRKMRRLSLGSSGSKVKRKLDPEGEAPTPVKFAKNPVFKHGNYSRYYGYRNPDLEPDLRLQYFKLEWFEGKDVLDIGCNAGHVTLAVAKLFHPQKIVGMDIDPNLIRAARQNIKKFQNLANKDEMQKYPASMTEYGPIEPLPALTNPSNFFPKNIMFMQGNYVLERDEQLNYVKEEYDTILALSITKWIHLNWGDDGLKRVFTRMYEQLRPGGRLILEPQAWASYRRRKKLTEAIYKNYSSIKLKPEGFSEYLLNTVGFCKREVIGLPFNPAKGFRRPLLLFTKFSDQSGTSPHEPISAHPSSPAPIYSIAARMASLAGYSSTPGVDTPVVSTPGVDTPVVSTPGVDTPVVSTPGVGTSGMMDTLFAGIPFVGNLGMDTPSTNTPGMTTPQVGTPSAGGSPTFPPPDQAPADSSSTCTSASSCTSFCSTCSSSTAGSAERDYLPGRGYPGSGAGGFGSACSLADSNTLEGTEVTSFPSEREAGSGPDEAAALEGGEEEEEEPMAVVEGGALLQPVYSEDLEPSYPAFYLSGDEENDLLQNDLVEQDGENSGWIPVSEENMYPEQASISLQASPLAAEQPLQGIQFHPLTNGSDPQFLQDNSLDQPGLNYSPGQLVHESSPEQLLEDSTPEQSVQNSFPEQFVEDSCPEPLVWDNSAEQPVQDTSPEQSVQDTSPEAEQSVQDNLPEQSGQD